MKLVAEPGTKEALVGAYGCGKSTNIELLERFYDQIRGQVTLDGVDVADLNVSGRRHFRFVSQMPTLSRLPFGRVLLLVQAWLTVLKMQNATRLPRTRLSAQPKWPLLMLSVMKMPEECDTIIGERDGMPSGDQKQRVATARASVCNPRILLFDDRGQECTWLGE